MKVQFLSGNKTSHLQPIGQGVSKAFKLNYKKFLLQDVVSSCDECKSAHEIAKYIDALVAVIWCYLKYYSFLNISNF